MNKVRHHHHQHFSVMFEVDRTWYIVHPHNKLINDTNRQRFEVLTGTKVNKQIKINFNFLHMFITKISNRFPEKLKGN